MRRRRHPDDRDDLGQRRIGVHVAPDDVDKVDLARRDQLLRDVKPLLARKALLPVFVGDHPDADDEVRPHRAADRVEHAEDEAQPIVEAAAILVGALVGGRRPELVREMAISLDLDAVEAGSLHALRRRGVVGDDPLDIPVLRLLREGPVGGFTDRRRREHGKPVPAAPAAGAPAEMGDLDHHRGAVRVTLVAEATHPRHDLILVGQQVTEGGRRIRRHHRRAGRHRQRDAALGLLHVVEPIAILRHAVLGVERLVGGAHQAIAHDEVLQAIGLKQRVLGRVHALSPGHGIGRAIGRLSKAQ